MKKSQFKNFLKEEIRNALNESPSELNEMAAIKGDIKVKADEIIAANPEMEVGPLARLIMKDPDINAIINQDNLSDMAQNQTQKYIRLQRGDRTIQARGRKADPNKPADAPKAPKKDDGGVSREQMVSDLDGFEGLEPADTKWVGKFDKLSNSALKDIWGNYFPKKEGGEAAPVNEMAKITGSLEDAIKSVIQNSELDGLELKKDIKSNKDVIAALGGDTLYDNQLNKFISLVRGEREVGKRGRKPLDPSKAPTTPNSPTPKTSKSLKDMVDGDEDEVEDNWSKLDTDFDDDFQDDDSNFTPEKSSSVDKEKETGLKSQETKKFWKEFIQKMKDEGHIGKDNKILDKETVEAERSKAQPELKKRLAGLK